MKRKNKHARRERDFEYMRWTKMQPCLLWNTLGAGPCSGAVEADHAGDRAGFRRADDRTCIPLCHTHHLARHAATGIFHGMSKEERREWRRLAIEETQARWARREFAIEW